MKLYAVYLITFIFICHLKQAILVLNTDMIAESDKGNSYQILTICDQSPTILKCSNKQHYLMIHKIIYGISTPKHCSLVNHTNISSNCSKHELNYPINNDFNCTGSNICLFYPESKQLITCHQKSSNLTQIHLTCVNLNHLKKYLSQLRTIKQSNQTKNIDLKENNKNNSKHVSNQTLFQNFHKSLLLYNNLEKNHDSIIILSIIMFCSLCAIILTSLIYYRFKIKQILAHTPCSITNQQHNILKREKNLILNSFYPVEIQHKLCVNNNTTSPNMSAINNNKKSKSNQHRHQSYIQKKLTKIRTSLIDFFNSTIRKPSYEHENDLVNINLRAQDIFIIDDNSSFIRTQINNNNISSEKKQSSDTSICKLPFKLNTNDYYDYEDIFTYFKTNNYATSVVPFNSSRNKEFESTRSNSRFVHILYDIPEEDSDYDDDSNEEDNNENTNEYNKCNFENILKI